MQGREILEIRWIQHFLRKLDHQVRNSFEFEVGSIRQNISFQSRPYLSWDHIWNFLNLLRTNKKQFRISSNLLRKSQRDMHSFRNSCFTLNSHFRTSSFPHLGSNRLSLQDPKTIVQKVYYRQTRLQHLLDSHLHNLDLFDTTRSSLRNLQLQKVSYHRCVL